MKPCRAYGRHATAGRREGLRRGRFGSGPGPLETHDFPLVDGNSAAPPAGECDRLSPAGPAGPVACENASPRHRAAAYARPVRWRAAGPRGKASRRLTKLTDTGAGSAAPPDGMRWFRFLVAGNATSSYGSYLNMVALNLFALHATGSALQTGLIMATRLVVGFATGSVAGGIVSRRSRKLVMICGDLSQAVALTALLTAGAGARPVLLYVVAVVAGAGGTLSQVALRSSVPEIVGQDLRVRANGLLATGRAFAMVLGFASAGVVVSAFGYRAAFVVDAATFVVSAANMAWLPIRTRGRRPAGPPAAAPRRGSVRAGLGVLRTAPVLAAMIAIRAVDGFGSASHNVGLPVYSSALDPAHPAAFVSRFWAVWAIGNIVVQRLVVRHARRTGRGVGERAFALGTCLMSAAFILVFTGPPLVVGIGFALLATARPTSPTRPARSRKRRSRPALQRASPTGRSRSAWTASQS